MRRLFFVGLGDRVEIWSSKSWQDKEKAVQRQASEMIDRLAKEAK